MSYIINLTNDANNPTVFPLTIQDGTINTQTGINIIGRNYTNYGDAQNENFVHLLENFADSIPPSLSSNALTPLIGTLWYDTANQRIRVYDGVNWSNASERIVSNVTPTSTNYTIKTGDQWYDTVNQQLNTWTGSAWHLVGPIATAAQGISGTTVGYITDTNGAVHTVANTYTQGNLVSITSYDLAFTPVTSIPGFGNILPGVSLVNTAYFNGNVTNANTVGFISPASFARVDQNSNFSQNITVAANVVLGNLSTNYANIHFSGANNLVLHNWSYNGNLNFYVNSTLGNITTLHIDGSSGLATVYADPVSNLGIATKQYVDTAVGAQVQDVQNVANEFYTSIEALQADYLANVNIIDGTIANLAVSSQANLVAVQTGINSNVAALTNSVAAYESWANANVASLQTQISNSGTNFNNLIANLAPKASPTFVGTPTAPFQTALVNYLTGISALAANIQLNQNYTINAGAYLTQYNSVSGQLIANLQCSTTTTGYYFIAQVITGNIAAISTTNNAILTLTDPAHSIFDQYQSGLTIVSANSTGQTLAYPGLGDLSYSIATTTYVDATANLIYGNVNTSLTVYNNLINNDLNYLFALKANVAGPVLLANVQTGLPARSAVQLTPLTYPSGPSGITSNVATGGDSSANLATTQFVNQSISNAMFQYTVSPNPPSGGTPGQFWFQTAS